MKVLFIDEESIVRKEWQNIIPWNLYGFSKYFEADNASDALMLINDKNPELIILDIHLKDMSGITLIQKAKENAYAGKIIIISKNTSFTNMKQAINYGVTAYLNKPADPAELSKAVSRVVDDIKKANFLSIYYEQFAELSKNNILSGILHGNMTYSKEMTSLYHIELNSNYYRLISFLLLNKSDKLHDIWEEALQLTKGCLSAVLSETELVFIALNPRQEHFIIRQLKVCQEHYSQYMSLLGIVGSQAGSHTELSTLYTESRHIYQNLYYFKREHDQIIYADALSQRLNAAEQMNGDLIYFTENIIRYILLLQSATLKEEILSLFNYLALRRPPKDSVRFILLNCYTQIISVLTNYYPKLEFELISKEELASHLSYDRYLCDSISYLNDQFQKSIVYIRGESGKAPCQRICQYIDMNYSQPLKLNTIANLLGYNSAYLGKLFSREMGVCFNTYLEKIRIQKAAEYLRKGIPVIKASELSGFNSPDYFTKKFKKHMGIVPSKYQTKHLAKRHIQITPPRIDY